MPVDREEAIVYRDNLFFDEGYIRTFITGSAEKGTPCRAAFSADDLAFQRTCPALFPHPIHRLEACILPICGITRAGLLQMSTRWSLTSNHVRWVTIMCPPIWPIRAATWSFMFLCGR